LQNGTSFEGFPARKNAKSEVAGTPIAMQSFGKLNRTLIHHLTNLLREDSGQDLIEYALLAALVGLAAATSMRSLATKIGDSFTTVGSTLTSSV
jgi:pilus assembly protein Flp/PilA